MDLYVNYGLYLLLGAFAGTLSGLLGVGGGVIIVPGFIWLFQYAGISDSMIMHMAAGTSLATMIVTASFSLYAHYRAGSTVGAILYLMIPALIVGTAGGAILAYYIHSRPLEIAFGIMILAVSLRELFIPEEKKNGAEPLRRDSLFISLGAGSIGVLSGLFGVGGGSLLVPFLEYSGIGMKKAITISVACSLVVAITGTISFILTGFFQSNLPAQSIGYIYLPAFIGVSIGSPIFAFLGTYIHQRIEVSVLKRIFSVFLIVVGLKLLFGG